MVPQAQPLLQAGQEWRGAELPSHFSDQQLHTGSGEGLLLLPSSPSPTTWPLSLVPFTSCKVLLWFWVSTLLGFASVVFPATMDQLFLGLL